MQQEEEKKVMVFGTFDVFHAGHEYFLKSAKKLGNYLIVVIAKDSTVKKIKGEFPKDNEKTRIQKVKNSKIADKVILGDEEDKYKAIKKYKPNVIALGYDQFIFTYGLNKLIIDENMNTEIIRLDAYKPNIYKSTLIKNSHENT
jgi:FAD synthetase